MSPFAIQILKQLHEVTGKTRWLFPATNIDTGHIDVKTVSKQVGDRQEQFKERTVKLKGRRQDNTLILANGANGNWTPHDLRRTGSTLMQALGVLLNVIDRCQNHILAGSKVRRSYMHHNYADEKRDPWNRLGGLLLTMRARLARVAAALRFAFSDASCMSESGRPSPSLSTVWPPCPSPCPLAGPFVGPFVEAFTGSSFCPCS